MSLAQIGAKDYFHGSYLQAGETGSDELCVNGIITAVTQKGGALGVEVHLCVNSLLYSSTHTITHSFPQMQKTRHADTAYGIKIIEC